MRFEEKLFSNKSYNNIRLDSEKEKKIDTIIYETNEKLFAIVDEMKAIKFSDLDDITKHDKTNSLRKEFENILNEQQRRVEEITKNEN